MGHPVTDDDLECFGDKIHVRKKNICWDKFNIFRTNYYL